MLKNKDYQVDLVIVACDARTAWSSTIERAKAMLDKHEKPRLVPVDKFDYNVNHITENLRQLINLEIFDDIIVINRQGDTLNIEGIPPEKALEDEINVNAWNTEKSNLEYEYLKFKSQILQQEIDEFEKH